MEYEKPIEAKITLSFKDKVYRCDECKADSPCWCIVHTAAREPEKCLYSGTIDVKWERQ